MHYDLYESFLCSVKTQLSKQQLQYVLCLFFFQTRKQNFGISYLCRDQSDAEIYQSLMSDCDLDVAFVNAAKPHLQLKMEIKSSEDSK